MDRIIDQLVTSLRGFSWLCCLFQVGHSLESQDSKDINLFGITTQGEIHTHFCKVKNLLTDLNCRDIRISDDSIRFLVKDRKTINLSFAEKDKLYALIQEYEVDHGYVERSTYWAIKSWIPEALFADLVYSEILFDKINISNSLKDSLSPYSEILREKILKRCKDEIEYKMLLLCKMGKEETLQAFLLKSDIAAALIRYSFAYDRIYLRGFQKILHQSEHLSEEGLEIFNIAKVVMCNNPEHIKQQIRRVIK